MATCFACRFPNAHLFTFKSSPPCSNVGLKGQSDVVLKGQSTRKVVCSMLSGAIGQDLAICKLHQGIGWKPSRWDAPRILNLIGWYPACNLNKTVL